MVTQMMLGFTDGINTTAGRRSKSAATETTTTSKETVARLLLIGTGCMGKIRANVIHCNPHTTLCGIVEPNNINYNSTAQELAELYMVSLSCI